MRKLPTFFIVGAARSGTTLLYHCLRQHPEIYMVEDELYKEPAFFCSVYGIENENKYFSLFSKANKQNKEIGEASTPYLTFPGSAKKISEYAQKYNINIKIIIILRNPVDRAYSLYNWMAQEGYEYVSNFEKALEYENIRKNKKIPNFIESQYYYDYLYFNSGLYYEQVKRYCKYFDKKNIYIIIFEKLLKNIYSELSCLYKFLKVNKEFKATVKKYNPSYRTKNVFFQYFLRKINTLLIKAKFKNCKTKAERDNLLKIGLIRENPKKLDLNIRKKLLDRYKENILQLEKLINQDLSIWKMGK